MNIRTLTAIAIGLTLISCNEDPELVRKRGEQDLEIAKLRGELALVEERMKRIPADKSSELASAQQESRKLEEEQKRLTSEVADLKAELQKIQTEYDSYKRKYAVK